MANVESDLIQQRDQGSRTNNGQGQVTDPAHDGRLKENGGGQNNQNFDSEGSGSGIQRITRLTVQGITYEATQSDAAGPSIRVLVDEVAGDDIDSGMSQQDVDNIVQFFTMFQRESRRGQGRRNVNDQTNSDGRGRVTNPETDGRLKGNESQRPNDPDRSAQAEGGRRGGQNSHGGR